MEPEQVAVLSRWSPRLLPVIPPARLVRRQRVGRIGVEVWAEFVGGDEEAGCFCDGESAFAGDAVLDPVGDAGLGNVEAFGEVGECGMGGEVFAEVHKYSSCWSEKELIGQIILTCGFGV